jgi:hypothetical protein
VPSPDFILRANDTASIITGTAEDQTGTPISIAGATVRFHMRTLNSAGTPVLNQAAANDQAGDGTDGTMGNMSYAWVAGNTAVSGFYLGEWEITFNNGKVQSFPNGGYVVLYISPEVA